MRIGVFSARQTQRRYAQKLTDRLKQGGFSPTHIWYKAIPLLPAVKGLYSEHNKLVPSIVSGYLREYQNRTPLQKSPSWKIYLLQCLKTLEARLLLARYTYYFKTKNFDYIVMWNGLKFRQKLACTAARLLNIPCIYIERGALPGTTMLDPKGINYLNSVPRDVRFYKQRQITLKAQMPERQDEEKNNNEGYIFIPFQVNTDSQLIFFSPWIKNMYHLVEVLLDAERNLGKDMPKIILKTHPSCS